MESWDWDDNPTEIVIGSKKPETVQDHIEAYRSSLQEAKRQASVSKDEEDAAEDEPDVNLFADMTPTVIAQKKLFVGPRSSEGSISSRGGRRQSNRLGVRDDLTDPILAMVRSESLAVFGFAVSQRKFWQEE